MNRVLLASVLAAGLLVMEAIGGQIQMPQQSIQGQTKTIPPPKTAPPKAAPTKAVTAKLAPATQGATAAQDQQIEAAIRAKLSKSKIGKDGLTVRVQGGVAFWEGSTTVVQHKGSATRMAKTAGAKSVINNIKVTDAAKQKAAENLDQGRRRAQVKRSDPRVQQ
jgi:hypothetical protein